jgi:hypothetical protein
VNCRATSALLLALLVTPLAAAPQGGGRVTELPRLGTGDGLAVFAVETPFDIETLEFAGPAGALLRIDRIKAGRDYVFVRALAGRWTLKRLTHKQEGQLRIEYRGGTEAVFEVQAGALTYHSDLLFNRGTPAVRLSVGGVAWDELGEAVRVRKWDAELLETLPFRLVGPALDDFRRYGAPEPQGDYRAWASALPPRLAAHLPLVNAVLAKYSLAAVSLGAERDTVWKDWDKLPKEDAVRMATGDGRHWLFLRGMWGVEGQAIGVSFTYERDRLMAVRLRAIDEWGNWQMPPADVLEDVGGWIDAP